MPQVSIRTGNDRLLKLANLLEADAKNKKGVKFDLEYWGGIPSLDHNVKPPEIRADCSTAACAVGLACISGAFKRSGLTYTIGAKARYYGNNIKPVYGSLTEFAAAQAFFSIQRDDFSHLFSSTCYTQTEGAVAERAVAKRIRAFVKERGNSAIR